MSETDQQTKQSMMVVKTLTGSIYEIIENEKRIRRLYGAKDPTSRQGTDGEWKEYYSIMLDPNNILVILWNDSGQATVTSPIVSVTFDGDNAGMN